MIEDIPIGALTNGIGVVGVLLIFVWLVATGRLVTRREVDSTEAMHIRELEDISHDRDEWRAAHRISEQARVEERENTRDLIDGFGTTLTGFLEGFRRAAEDAAHGRREADQA